MSMAALPLAISRHRLIARASLEPSYGDGAAVRRGGDSAEAPPPPGCSRIQVKLRKPLGVRLREEALTGRILVAEVLKGGNAERSRLVDVGDELLATSAVVYNSEEEYQGVWVRKGMQIVRLSTRGEKFDTVVAAIGTHPGYMDVTLELQKCPPSTNGAAI